VSSVEGVSSWSSAVSLRFPKDTGEGKDGPAEASADDEL
jgi:hypothetical protein